MLLSDLKSIAISKLSNIPNKEYEANLFIRDILGLSLYEIFINNKIEIEEDKVNLFLEALNKRVKGIPYNYILKYKEFYGRKFYVDNRVLIPRPETEIMVEECIKRNKNKIINNYLDLCTGSGCIGITINKELNIINTTFSDISKNAIDVCTINSKNYNVNCNIVISDLFSSLSGKYDLITINPPYVPLERKPVLDSVVIDYEPEIALFSGDNGLELIERFFKEVDYYITDNAYIYMEFDETQTNQIVNIINRKKFEYKIFKDYNNMDRFIIIERRKKC